MCRHGGAIGMKLTAMKNFRVQEKQHRKNLDVSRFLDFVKARVPPLLLSYLTVCMVAPLVFAFFIVLHESDSPHLLFHEGRNSPA
jgi:hypothetical protein